MIDCDGIETADGYSCNIAGNYFNVTGLKHSVVVEFTGEVPDEITIIIQDRRTDNLLLGLFGILAIFLIILISMYNRKKWKISGKNAEK